MRFALVGDHFLEGAWAAGRRGLLALGHEAFFVPALAFAEGLHEDRVVPSLLAVLDGMQPDAVLWWTSLRGSLSTAVESVRGRWAHIRAEPPGPDATVWAEGLVAALQEGATPDRTRPHERWRRPGVVSVVMTYKDRRAQLQRTLETIEASAHPKAHLEVICLDDASAIEPAVIDYSRYSFRVLLLHGERDRPAHRINSCMVYNEAMRHALGDVVFIQNAECLHVGDLISDAVQQLRFPRRHRVLSFPVWATPSEAVSQEVFAARGDPLALERIIQGHAQTKNAYLEAEYAGWYNERQIRPRFLHFCNAMRRETLERVGLFDVRMERLLGCDDVEWAERFAFGEGCEMRIPDHDYRRLAIHQDHSAHNAPRPYALFLRSREAHRVIQTEDRRGFARQRQVFFARIPRIAHYFWEGELSYLAYACVASFLEHHPRWRVILHRLDRSETRPGWSSFHQKGRTARSAAYMRRLVDAPNLHVRAVTPECLRAIGLADPARFDAVALADLYRYYALHTTGGFWIDSDLLFSDSLDRLAEIPRQTLFGASARPPEILLNRYADPAGPYDAIGLIAGARGARFWARCFAEALTWLNQGSARAYQDVGGKLVRELIEQSPPDEVCVNFPKAHAYQVDHNRIGALFREDVFEEVADKIAVHLYNAAPLCKWANNHLESGSSSGRSTVDRLLSRLESRGPPVGCFSPVPVTVVISCAGARRHGLGANLMAWLSTRAPALRVVLLDNPWPDSFSDPRVREGALETDPEGFVLHVRWDEGPLGDIPDELAFTDYARALTLEVHEAPEAVVIPVSAPDRVADRLEREPVGLRVVERGRPRRRGPEDLEPSAVDAEVDVIPGRMGYRRDCLLRRAPRPIYFLHVPRSGGTSAFECLRRWLRFKPGVINGNWVDEAERRIPFWSWSRARQLDALRDVDVVFNEDQLGDEFYPEHADYTVVLRDPIDVVLSVLQNEFFRLHQVDRAAPKARWFSDFERHLEARLDAFENYVLRFFSGRDLDRSALVAVFESRIAHFEVIDFDDLAPQFDALFRRRYGLEVNLEHLHARYGAPVERAELTMSHQAKLRALLREDVEAIQRVRAQRASVALSAGMGSDSRP